MFRQRNAGALLLCLWGRNDGTCLQGDLYGTKPVERYAALCTGEKPAALALPFLVRFYLSLFDFSSVEEIQAENQVLTIKTKVCKQALFSLKRMLRGMVGDEVAVSAVVTKYLYRISTHWAFSPFFPQMWTVPNCFCIADVQSSEIFSLLASLLLLHRYPEGITHMS